ncbi:MAG: pentapeptide repeat-containing protein [Thermomicrobiales bacterium]|nr:pentapeptide repeat-containing protein [Thermomicrobiales bacterium]
MSAFTRIALVALSGMAGRMLRSRKHAAANAEKTRAAGASPPSPWQATAQPALPPDTPTIPTEETSRSDPFRNLTYRRAPRVASVAARSLPIIGILSTLLTITIAIGTVAGELPGVGPVEDTNLAWAATLVTISIWAVYLLWRVPQWQANAWARHANASPRELFEIENESRGTLGQILSGVAVLTGLIFAWQQLGQTSDNLRVSQEGQITDRFSRAVDQLGSDQYTIRLGGVYALERIARDSPRDYGPVMEVLTAFARQESPVQPNASATPAPSAPGVPADVQAVFKVIGRRTEAQIAAELEEGHGCLDLTRVNAVGADLAGANLQNTCWDGSDLRGAIVSGANLSDSYFGSVNFQQANLDRVDAERAQFNSANLALANLSQGNFTGANFLAADMTSALLQGTDLDGASLLRARLQNATAFGATMNGANLLDANLSGAVLADADLSGADQLTADQVTAAVTNSGTRLPPGLEVPPDF